MHCTILSPTINKKTPQAPSTIANPAWRKHKPAHRFLGRLFLGQWERARQEPAGTTALGNPATSMHSAQTLVNTNSRMYCHRHVQGILQQACTGILQQACPLHKSNANSRMYRHWHVLGILQQARTLHKPWLTAGCTFTDNVPHIGKWWKMRWKAKNREVA